MRIRWRDFELPSSVEADTATQTREYAKFIIEPFERGFGHTVGNSLRRVLLSSLEGAALYAVKIEGVPHEFSAMDGVYEDVTDIVLRLKQLRLAIHEGNEVELRIEKDTKGQVLAGDIQCPSTAEILNPELVLATLTADVRFAARLWGKQGRGYVTAEEFATAKTDQEIGVVYLDAAFSPVARVRYLTEDTRVGQKTNYDRLILEIWTNGVVAPDLALVEAAKILRKHLNPFVQYTSLGPAKQAAGLVGESEGQGHEALMAADIEGLGEKLARPVAELNLTVRANNCLESQKIVTVGDLVRLKEAELLQVENLGRTTLGEIKRRLDEWGLRLGMEIPEAVGKAEA